MNKILFSLDMRVRIIYNSTQYYREHIRDNSSSVYVSIQEKHDVEMYVTLHNVDFDGLLSGAHLHDVFCVCTEDGCKFKEEAVLQQQFPLYVIGDPTTPSSEFFIVHPDERDRMHRYLHPPAVSPAEQALIDIAHALKNTVELGLDREAALNDFNKRTRNEGDL